LTKTDSSFPTAPCTLTKLSKPWLVVELWNGIRLGVLLPKAPKVVEGGSWNIVVLRLLGLKLGVRVVLLGLRLILIVLLLWLLWTLFLMKAWLVLVLQMVLGVVAAIIVVVIHSVVAILLWLGLLVVVVLLLWLVVVLLLLGPGILVVRRLLLTLRRGCPLWGRRTGQMVTLYLKSIFSSPVFHGY